MPESWRYTFWAIIWSIIGFGVGVSITAGHAQQKAENTTKRWTIGIERAYTRAPGATIPHPHDLVHVIDTEGVCLYVVQGEYYTVPATLAAVPKTLLPKGTGCE